MVKLVDTSDLKSAAIKKAYGFDSRSGHHQIRAIAADPAMSSRDTNRRSLQANPLHRLFATAGCPAEAAQFERSQRRSNLRQRHNRALTGTCLKRLDVPKK